MARGSPLLAFVAGAGEGYLGAQRQKRRDAQEDEDRAMRKQEFSDKQEELQRAKSLRLSLADAARPAQIEQGGGGMLRPDTMDNRDVGLPENASQPNAGLSLSAYRVGGKNYDTAGAAQTAADAYNAPDAKIGRHGQALEQGGQPLQALTLASASQKMKQDQSKFTADQATQAKKLKEEGVFDAVRALRAGDASGVATAFNQSGQYKLDGQPVITKEDREVPGIGKIPTYTAKIRMIGPDGQAVEKTYNSHDLSMQMMPYEKALELQRKGTDSDNKAQYQGALIDARSAALEAKTAAAESKQSGQPTREERLRYTSLFQDAGRRAGETQRAISSLQRDPMFASALRRNPNGPEAMQLRELQDSLKTHNEERTTYQGLLSGSQGTPRLSLGDASPKSSRDAGRAEILQQEMEAAKQRLANGDTRAQGDIDALTREMGGAKQPAASRPAAPAAPKVGAVQGGYRFKGGNPADQKNWEKA